MNFSLGTKNSKLQLCLLIKYEPFCLSLSFMGIGHNLRKEITSKISRIKKIIDISCFPNVAVWSKKIFEKGFNGILTYKNSVEDSFMILIKMYEKSWNPNAQTEIQIMIII